MLKKSLIIFPIFLLVFAAAFPQGRGGRQGGQQSQGQGQGQGSGQGQGQGNVWGEGQAGVGQKEQKRIHTTQQQRDQISSCNKLADGIQKQARKMAQTKSGNFNVEDANQQRVQIRDQFQTMEQEHERLMNGLDAAQNQAWQKQIRNMDAFRQQLKMKLQEMDTELGSANPDSKRITERAKEMERIMNNWRKEYNTFSSQAGGF